MTVLSPPSLQSIFRMIAQAIHPGNVSHDDVRAEMRRFLTAKSPDAKAALRDLVDALATTDSPVYTLSEDGTTILVDTEDPTAPDGYGRTYYLTLTEIPR
jgi:hypothetical protein